MIESLLLLGSNIEPAHNIKAALHALDQVPQSYVRTVSRTYITPAIGADGKQNGQPDFHNIAVHFVTELEVTKLRQTLREIEAKQGRVRTQDKFAARPLDIDIAFFGQAAMTMDGTRIPDPDILQRSHVVIPLAEIAPDWRHPQTNQTLDQIAGQLENVKLEFETV
jgi:2-amino-4-hydroxy-6-hydroxymethyldihydropteridine diphosphokinase